MTIRTGSRVLLRPLRLALALAGPCASAADGHAQHDHEAGSAVRRDAEGRRLESYNQRHEMTPEMREALRKKVALSGGSPIANST